MKTENIIWGLVLVFVGVILMLDNFGVIDFYWRTLWQFWPLILIILGANMIFAGKNSKANSAVAISITVAALGFIAYQGINHKSEDHNGWNFNWHKKHRDRNRDKSKADTSRWDAGSSFTEPFNDSIKNAKLTISGGATYYELKNTTSNLFDADVRDSEGSYTLKSMRENGVQVLDFKMNGHDRKWDVDDDDQNRTEIKLNSKPNWDIILETGAGKTEFDLTPFKVNNLEFKGGAASFEAKLGEPQTVSNVRVETGVASIEINVPRSVGCRIKLESGLSSKDFDDFTQQPDGTYTTSNYNSSVKKIEIELRGGLSEFKVKRY